MDAQDHIYLDRADRLNDRHRHQGRHRRTHQSVVDDQNDVEPDGEHKLKHAVDNLESVES